MATADARLDSLVPSCCERLVAAEPGPDGDAMLIFRDPDDSVRAETVPFRPWVLVAGTALAGQLRNVDEIVELEGPGTHKVRVHFPDQETYFQALKDLRTVTDLPPTSPQAPYRVFSDLQQQLLTLLPARLFRGMSFAEIRRMQIDIETLTTPGYDFPNAEREGDSICLIAMRDNRGWETCLCARDTDEKTILKAMVAHVRDRDPDVIEGHNIFSFDLDYIQTRCRRHRVRLDIGRGGRGAKSRSSRFAAGERTSTYPRFDVYGRHVVDTLQLVQLYDVIHRDLDSYGLKAVARHFGVAAPDRTYVDGSRISALYERDAETLKAYALDDVRETEAIAARLSPSFFYQAQLVPFSYQSCVTRGNASRIDAMLAAAYLLEQQSLPTPQAPRPFRGGLTEAFQTGVFSNVWHVDVRSLYPSIIISRALTPRDDRLGVFNRLLTELRNVRLAAKDAARSGPDAERGEADALQSSLKILINSFYGYTGFAQATFNDFDLAETVTATGRDILQSMHDFLVREGAVVIEMDTDGVYFVPPKGITDTETMEARVQSTLPPGIEVELDKTYRAMFGYKSKNYALLDHDGNVAITGAALKSRGIERFQRDYIRELVTLLLNGRTAAAGDLHAKYERAILDHALPLADLAKRENLSTSPKVYAEKLAAGKSKRSAAYDLVLATDREYKQGDQVAFYVTGTKKSVSVTDAARLLTDADPDRRDENIPYYLDKLAKLRAKFAEFIDA